MSNSHSKIFAFTGLVLVSSFVSAHTPDQSQQNKRRGPPAFSQLDINGDSNITLDEFKQHQLPFGDHQKVFSSIDGNGDLLISASELSAFKPPCPPRSKR